jgi:hypothetical protein
MHAISAWLAFSAMQHRHYCEVTNAPHLTPVDGLRQPETEDPARCRDIEMEWAMTDSNTKTVSANLLTWAAIVGAAALFFEVTVSSLNPVPAQTATVHTITVAHPDRLARN